MNVKQESYTVQPHWMISDYHLKGTELDVYCLIWGFTQDEQGCYYGSIKYLLIITRLTPVPWSAP